MLRAERGNRLPCSVMCSSSIPGLLAYVLQGSFLAMNLDWTGWALQVALCSVLFVLEASSV